MKTRMVEERIGENMGPVDWTHETAKDKPPIWREAEKDPDSFMVHFADTLTSWRIVAICMYDGWPYWTPRPAIQYIGPLGRSEWTFFDSRRTTITRREATTKPHATR